MKKFNYQLALLALPGFATLIAFYYVPLFGLLIPFKKMNYRKGIFGSPWVGFKNFEFFFKSNDAIRITRNTILLNALFITVTLSLAIIIALILYEFTRRSVKVYQTAIFMPYFLSWVSFSYIIYAFLNPTLGLIPTIQKQMGLTPINFYFEASYWPAILLGSYVWKNIGYTTLLFYTALLAVDVTYFEAAEIDGASKLQRIFHISLPTIGPVISLVALLQIGKIFYSDFGMFYFTTMDSGALYKYTDVIDTYVFRALRVTGEIGMAAAVGLIQSVMGLILVVVTNKIAKKFDSDYGLF
ncbi:MAG: sugar ABC transporter permease [Spirochaetales bacterium]|nr:sugar ABC transporter permease [Spirochaetales bacterium]